MDPARLAGGVGRGRRHMTQAGDDARLWKIKERAGRRAPWWCSGAIGEAPQVLVQVRADPGMIRELAAARRCPARPARIPAVCR